MKDGHTRPHTAHSYEMFVIGQSIEAEGQGLWGQEKWGMTANRCGVIFLVW